MWDYGGVAILFYPVGADVVTGDFLLISDGTYFLETDNTPMKLAGA